MSSKIEPNSVYSTDEAQKILKISNSTIKRLLKRGVLRANKVGGQYRIMGKEILRLISPKIERKTVNIYQKAKSKAKERLNKW